jgi:hypothetical protein
MHLQKHCCENFKCRYWSSFEICYDVVLNEIHNVRRKHQGFVYTLYLYCHLLFFYYYFFLFYFYATWPLFNNRTWRLFNNPDTKDCHWAWSRGTIHSQSSQSLYLKYSLHVVSYPSGCYSRGLPTKILYVFLALSTSAICQVYHNLIYFSIMSIPDDLYKSRSPSLHNRPVLNDPHLASFLKSKYFPAYTVLPSVYVLLYTVVWLRIGRISRFFCYWSACT